MDDNRTVRVLAPVAEFHTLDYPPAATGEDAGPGPHAPAGRFALGAELARGGMGIVYAARDTHLGRDVAVKVLLARLANTWAERRFRTEAEITGRLQHPGIPPVYDLGTLPDGRPYLAMKLIKGRTLAELLAAGADAGRLVAVFEGICQAVGYAHSLGVIHRDLKPANVMVGAFGEVQVMDWGLAKPLGEAETVVGGVVGTGPSVADQTRVGQAFGTPGYMAPEQARGELAAVDRRSDVFGLGGLLCTILTGRPPFVGGNVETTLNLAARGDLADAHDRLYECDADPDLVALCRRCLAANPAARPADAGEVAAAVAALREAAVERARAAEVERERAAVRVVEARRRRRLVSLAAGAVLGVSLAGAGLAGWQAVRATRHAADADRQRQAAEAEQAKATDAAADTKAFGDYLVDNFLSAARPAGVDGGLGIDVKVVDALAKAEGDLPKAFAGRPKAEATARLEVGNTWRNLGRYDRAEPLIRRAIELREQALGADHLDTLYGVNDLGLLLLKTGRFAAAADQFQRVLAGREVALGPDHLDTLQSLFNLAAALVDKGDRAAGEPMLRRALAGCEAVHGPLHSETLRYRLKLSSLLRLRNDPEAEAVTRQVVAGCEALHGPDNRDTLAAVNGLAVILKRKGDYTAARPLYERAVATFEKLLGPDHTDTLAAVNNLALLLREVGDPAAAEPLFRRAVAGFETALGPDNTTTLVIASNLAKLLMDRNDLAAAEPLYRRSLAGQERALGPDHPTTLKAVHSLGLLLKRRGMVLEAEGLNRRALAGYEKAFGPTHPDTLQCVHNLATLAADRGDLAAAELLYRRALAGRRTARGATHRITLKTAYELAVLYSEHERPGDAAPLFREVYQGYETYKDGAFDVAVGRANLGLSLTALGQPAEAEPHLRAGHAELAAAPALSPANRRTLGRVLRTLAELADASEAGQWRARLAALPPELAPPPRPAK